MQKKKNFKANDLMLGLNRDDIDLMNVELRSNKYNSLHLINH